ncbi:c-type cytochrome [Hydrogenimonas sp.]
MKRLLKMTFLGIVTFASVSNGAQKSALDAKTLFEQKCAMCHITKRPTPEMKKSLVAPPIMGVMHHIKDHGLDENEAVKFITDYVLHPSKEKALCEAQGIERFGLMPSQQGNVTEKELETIAHYIYRNFPPKGFRHRGMHK